MRRPVFALSFAAVAAWLAVCAHAAPEASCRFVQDCIPQMLDDPNCYPRPVYDDEAYPQPFDGTFMDICPQYAASACCSGPQRQLLQQNFKLIKSTFGETGGCGACYQNVVDLWCAFTCAPDQRWTEYGEIMVVPDPENKPTLATVLTTNPLVDKEFACSLFASCADTTYVNQFAPIGTCAGFFTYQGSTEGVGHGTNILWHYTNSSTPSDAVRMSYPTMPCNNFRLPGDSTNQSCPCSTCSSACITEVESVPVLEGFDGVAVGLMYGFVVLLTLLAMHCQHVRAVSAKQAGQYARLDVHVAASE